MVFNLLVSFWYPRGEWELPRSTISLSACRTRHGGETRILFRYVPWERGRATGTFPRAHRVRVHRWNRCGTQHRPLARTHSCPVSREYTWPRRFRSWPRPPRLDLRRRATATFEQPSL